MHSRYNHDDSSNHGIVIYALIKIGCTLNSSTSLFSIVQMFAQLLESTRNAVNKLFYFIAQCSWHHLLLCTNINMIICFSWKINLMSEFYFFVRT